MSRSVTTFFGAIPSKVAAFTNRFRIVMGPSRAGANGSASVTGASLPVGGPDAKGADGLEAEGEQGRELRTGGVAGEGQAGPQAGHGGEPGAVEADAGGVRQADDTAAAVGDHAAHAAGEEADVGVREQRRG